MRIFRASAQKPERRGETPVCRTHNALPRHTRRMNTLKCVKRDAELPDYRSFGSGSASPHPPRRPAGGSGPKTRTGSHPGTDGEAGLQPLHLLTFTSTLSCSRLLPLPCADVRFAPKSEPGAHLTVVFRRAAIAGGNIK
ncbi:hypothetical protein AGIG_G15580 [Arapaima gigas]